jgi:hypothetical protein
MFDHKLTWLRLNRMHVKYSASTKRTLIAGSILRMTFLSGYSLRSRCSPPSGTLFSHSVSKPESPPMLEAHLSSLAILSLFSLKPQKAARGVRNLSSSMSNNANITQNWPTAFAMLFGINAKNSSNRILIMIPGQSGKQLSTNSTSAAMTKWSSF